MVPGGVASVRVLLWDAGSAEWCWVVELLSEYYYGMAGLLGGVASVRVLLWDAGSAEWCWVRCVARRWLHSELGAGGSAECRVA